MDTQQEAAQDAVEIPPRYTKTCECGCNKPATHTILLWFWEHTTPGVFRGKHNGVKLFPGVVACDEHKFRLSEVGLRIIGKARAVTHEVFQKLSKDPPDMADGLIEMVTLDEALQRWATEPTKPH